MNPWTRNLTAIVVAIMAGSVAGFFLLEGALTAPNFLAQWSFAAAISGGIARFLTAHSVARTAGLVGAGFGIAEILRVIVGIVGDPTSHNLWPIGVLIAMTVGLIGGAVGAVFVPNASLKRAAPPE